MISAISSPRAYEKGHGFDLDLPEWISSCGNGNIRSFTCNPLKAIAIMPRPIESFFERPSLSLIGSLKAFLPVTLKLVSGSGLEPVWDYYVKQFHYLGYQKLLGRRLKYLALIQDHPVAALSWSAPALKIGDRDRFIGWSEDQRMTYLDRIANNSRFLILPWVNVRNLASHVLSLNIKRLGKDWEQQFNKRLWLLETFVDPSRFKGTSYKAANWKLIGQTNGFGKQGRKYVHHGAIKEVYVYVLEPRFREIIGCRQKPQRLFHRPPQSQRKVEELTMILEHCQWHPQLVADIGIDEKNIKTMAQELVDFHKQFHKCFGRIEHQRLGLAYISGLMSNAKAKSAEPIALEFLDKKSVRSMQQFMKTYRWDHEAMQITHQSMLAPMISQPDGMITVDPCEFVKKGKESVGVARQYCGTIGKVENCQSGVFVGYSSHKGYGLLTCRLYIPESWFTQEQEQRRKANLVPEDLVFETKQRIALELIDKVISSGLFPAKWIGADAAFGNDIDFLNALPNHLYYFASIRSDAKVFTKKPKIGLPAYKGRGRRPSKVKVLPSQPKSKRVSDITQSKRLRWKSVIVAEGAKGPIVAEVARIRVYLSRDGLPVGDQVWLFLRKNVDGQIKYAISNAPKQISFSELIKASTMRWPIEQCFQEGKDQVGMDYYEHRSWPAWHRHMTYVFLALHFLLRLRLKFKKNTFAHSTFSSQVVSDGTSHEIAHS
jgi:SRSO17 transposase